jgi:cobalt-zinc-cadmium efflux system protein
MTRVARLVVVLSLNLALVTAMLVVGIAAHSLALLAEGGDYLLDAAGIGVALCAIWLSGRARRSPGARPYPDAGAWAALVNASWLLLLELLVMAGAVDRLVTGVPAVRGLPVLILSGVAAIGMTASALVLGADLYDDEADDDEERGHRLSVQAVLLDAGADAAAAAGVAVAGAIMWVAHGIYWLDPAVALVIAAVISWHAARLLTRVRLTLVAHRSLWHIDTQTCLIPGALRCTSRAGIAQFRSVGLMASQTRSKPRQRPAWALLVPLYRSVRSCSLP